MYSDVMIDIETLSTANNALVVTIGACGFNLQTGEVDEGFYCNINVRSAHAAGLDLNPDTILWWMGQSESARKALSSDNAKMLDTALKDLTEYIKKVRGDGFKKNFGIWANDPTFDTVILENAYGAINEPPPWNFWETRSQRTIVALAYQLKGFNHKKDFKREGTHHNALDDSIYQAKLVHKCYKVLES